jgi:putative ubiquitin-RnfH superfamily antitoxin RatB of RatAB toxin-antitoxin module
MAALHIQVCYALPGDEWLRALEAPEGTTLREAVEMSGLLRERAEIDLDRMRVGIYGKLKTLDSVLKDQDRVEVYRNLVADPKESRRRRAESRARRQKE